MSDSKKVALVTGGNRGIGFELCKQLAVKGYHVLLASRDSRKGSQAVKKLQDMGLDVTFLELDVEHVQKIAEVADFVQQAYGRLDVLVNNAGVYLDEGVYLSEIKPGYFEKTMQTNLFGPFHLIRAFLPLMKQNNFGRIVNVSSGYGQMDEMDHPGTGSYKLSKLALNGLTRLFASELSGNIKINAVCPGWVRTDMGGPHAPRSVGEAAESILWLVDIGQDGPNGKFFRDGKEIRW